ncbi:dihydrofolate reductase-like isoform X2, partial [Clarias magur]
GDLIEELLCVLSQRKLLSRASLHLLLLPQLHTLSLSHSCNLVTANLCSLISVRCQSLKSLDLSGAQNVSSTALCSLLTDLSCLHSLSLAGSLCDRGVIATVALRCSRLQHLDVSRCLHLSPGALLPLALRGPKRLTSLVALDIGLGQHEEDGPVSAAVLLLGVSGLHRLALEGLGHACVIIQNQDFDLTRGFTTSEGVPCLTELWEARFQENDQSNCDGEENSLTLEEKTDRSLSLEEDKRTDKPKGCLKLHLREVQGLTLHSLDAVSSLCPDLHSISLNCHDDDEDEDSSRSIRLTRGLARWSGQLRFLSLRFLGPLSELVPPLQVCGSCLLSLTLEGVQADGNLPFISLLRSCPKLTALTIHIDPPRSNQEQDDDDDDEDLEGWDLPRLPDLRTLTL